MNYKGLWSSIIKFFWKEKNMMTNLNSGKHSTLLVYLLVYLLSQGANMDSLRLLFTRETQRFQRL